ncbi:hypothetical protein SAMN05421842_1279 [Clostridium uliginosum]|uniref:Uncharacterized protein n=1 Tax=Clostridium uliginosum TaxID=119641 RepID=A0A1I1QS27_9CLOT|nr:hypothetical protein SAMN05421842_1279 [Clostridium uliginosum]
MNKLKVEKVNFYSDVLGKEMSMLVYLPECYNSLRHMKINNK